MGEKLLGDSGVPAGAGPENIQHNSFQKVFSDCMRR